MRRNGAHSVSDCVEIVWRPPSKDTDVRRYACPVCGGRENGNQVHDVAESRAGAAWCIQPKKWWLWSKDTGVRREACIGYGIS